MKKMEGQVCPYCKSTTFSNPNLKILINICGHTLCESCVNVIFCRGYGKCPECNGALRRNDYREQLFEDPNVEKELQIRKSVLKYYNKKEDDFETLAEYNDYLEEIEVIISNLTNKVDVANTNKRIDEYKRLNSDNIQRNRSRMGPDEKEIHDILALENEQDDARRLELEQMEAERKKKRENFKTALLDELQFGTKDAGAVINEFVEKANKMREEEKIVTAPKPVQPSWQNPTYRNAGSLTNIKAPKLEDDGPLYVYKEPELPFLGSHVPTMQEIKKDGYLKHICKPSEAAQAGGYCPSLGCHRAVQEAIVGLFI